MERTCLDPSNYGLKGDVEFTLLDVPDGLHLTTTCAASRPTAAMTSW
jgi:hypothetical protein